ncbi:MAG: hypothetical protein IT373_00425 [Polyangiaceae bacterium]|nr:hypothetical protein [Polyangiaceae bacterium]
MVAPPTSTGTPSLRHTRAALRQVAEVVLAENEAHLQVPPVARTVGPPAIGGHVRAKMCEAERSGDTEAEREHALVLGRRCIHRHLDLTEAVRLAYRALAIRDDRALRSELSGWLTGMGRLIEAGHVLLHGGEGPLDPERRESLLAAGALFARGGDPRTAVRTLREAGVIAPDDARPLEMLASIACYAPETLSTKRAALVWLEAARRYPGDSDLALEHTARAFGFAPGLQEAAEAMADALARQGRAGAADEVLRAHGAAVAGESDVVRQRPGLAWALGAWPTALGAAIEACIAGAPSDDERDMALADLLERPEVAERLGATAAEAKARAQSLLAAARTRTSMGRAKALAKVAVDAEPELRGVLLAIAADSYALAGNAQRARQTALEAARAAPRLARAQGAVLELCGDELDAAALEAAAGVLPVREVLFRLAAERFAADGEAELALCWTRRALELLPGDGELARLLCQRALATGNPGLMADAALFVLSLPRPLGESSGAFAAILVALAGASPEAALDLGRRVVGTCGTGRDELWDALLTTARTGGDVDFELALLARRAATGDLGAPERAALFVRCAELCLARGDGQTAAEYAALAAPHAELTALGALLDALEPAMEATSDDSRSDAVIAVACVRAELEQRMGLESAWMAWRELGGLRWDLAGDAIGAEDAFFNACRNDPTRAPYLYARDLCDRLGVEHAARLVVHRAGLSDTDPALVARALTAVARLAHQAGDQGIATATAVAALERDPSRGEALALLETTASGPAAVEPLDHAYDVVAAGALGRYGLRAAHYRGARQLEQRGAHREALRHAIAAFEAVPAEGATYQLLLRLAERCDERDGVVKALSTVAAAAPAESRGVWLKRAAAVAAQKSTMGRETRFDLVLKAFRLRPTAELVEELRGAVRELMDRGDDEIVRLRFERAVVSALPRLSGPRGARTALGLCKLAAQSLRDPRLAAMAVQRAMDVDLEGSDFAPVLPLVDLIASDDGATVVLVEHIHELQRDERYALPPSLLELCAALEATLRPRAKGAQPAPEPDSRRDAAAAGPPPSEPADSEAERQARARGDHQAIAHLLAARTQTTADPQQRRLIRLRRAAVLEQRLGQLDDACRELELILEEVGEDTTALRYLADLRHRRGQDRAAAAAWERAARHATSPDERERDLTRAAEALLACGDLEAAQTLLGEPDLPESPALLRLRAKAAERADNPFAVGEALAALARLEAERGGERPRTKPPSKPPPPATPTSRSAPPQTPISRPPPTVRAGSAPPDSTPAPQPAEPAPTSGPAPAAHDGAETPEAPTAGTSAPPAAGAEPASGAVLPDSVPPSAKRIATPRPVESADGVLEAVRLGYRLHGIGAPRDAKRLISQLRSLEPSALGLEQRDLATFLLAEALDAVQGGGAALKELERHWKHVGHTPLVAVGVAERMVRRNDLGAALHFFERAVGGRLQGLRSPGAIALKAADVAHATGKDENARRLLELARLERDSRATAEQRLGAWFEGGRVSRDSEAMLTVLGEEELAADGDEELPEEDSQVFEASAFRLEAEALESQTEAERTAIPPSAPEPSRSPPAAPPAQAGAEPAPTDLEDRAEPALRPSGEYLEPAADDVTLVESHRPPDDEEDDDGETDRPTVVTELPTEGRASGDESVGAEAGPSVMPDARPTPEPSPSLRSGEPYEPSEMFAPNSEPASGEVTAVLAREDEREAYAPGEVTLEPSHGADDDAFTTPYEGGARAARGEPHDSGTEFDLPSAEPSDEGLAQNAAALVEGPEIPIADAWAHETDTTLPQGGSATEPPDIEVAAPTGAHDHDPEGEQPTLMPPPDHDLRETLAAPPRRGPTADAPSPPAEDPQAAWHEPEPEPRPVVPHVPATRATPPPPPSGASPRSDHPESPSSAPSPPVAPAAAAPRSSLTPVPARPTTPTPIPAAASPMRASRPTPVASPPPFAPRPISERPPASAPRMPDASLRPRRRLSSPELPEVQGPDEAQLLSALLDGSPQAAEALYRRYLGQGPERSRDALRAAQLWWSASRGDVRALRELRAAAARDGNAAYARALDHVLVAFDPRAPAVDPPPLNELVVQPELTTRLVFSGLSGGINEALGIVCETGKFRHELADYGLSGTARVPAGTPTPVGAVYTMLLQLLDIGAIRLFHQQRNGALGGQVVLLSPLAAVIQGSADRDSPVLRYVVAEALAAAMPQCALVLGLSDEQLRTVLGALAAGFGPVGAAADTTPEQMRLADDFWHLVPAAAGRRLHQIYQSDADTSFEAAYVAARRACRRAGLFAAGDIATAVGRTLEELELANEAPLGDAEVLPWLFRLPEVADVIELATRPEYAEARWRPGR